MSPPPPAPIPERFHDLNNASSKSSSPTKAATTAPSSPPPLGQQHYYRAVALDLDGTLLQSNHQLSRTTIEYLRYLHHHRHITILIATGRAIPSVYEHLLALHFDLPVICSNGAKGLYCRVPRHANNNNSNNNNNNNNPLVLCDDIFDAPVPKPVVLRTIALARRLGNHMVQFYYGDTISGNPNTPFHFQLMKRYTELTGSPVHVSTDDFASFLQQDQLPSKMLVLFPNDCAEQVRESFVPELGVTQQAAIVRGSYGWFLEILHPNVSKGHGLARMLQHLNIPISQCVAFGDSDNDLEFLQMAGLGIAMQNAKPYVQEAADHISPWTNDEDGVIRTLQDMEDRGLLLA